MASFADFPLRPEIMRAIEDAGYQTPTRSRYGRFRFSSRGTI